MQFFGTHKNIVILLGHPDTNSFCNALAEAYARGAKAAGHSVTRFNVSELRFDPVLHKGYKVIQELEPDLKNLQNAIKAADHFVVIYPNWWCTMPALLKGLFDRMWLPGFAFRFPKDKHGKPSLFPQRLLIGKTGRVIVPCGSHPWLVRLAFGDFTNEISRGILWFSGIRNRVTRFGPSETCPSWMREHWLKKVERLGTRAK